MRKANKISLSASRCLLTDRQIPGTDALLGLGLNYCITPSSTTKTTDGTFDRMRNDVRRLYAFADTPPEEQGYNRKLYIKSDYKF